MSSCSKIDLIVIAEVAFSLLCCILWFALILAPKNEIYIVINLLAFISASASLKVVLPSMSLDRNLGILYSFFFT